MSRPENPLARFRTYSYHHILVACENTEVAEALSVSQTVNDFMRGGPSHRAIGPETISTVKIKNGVGKYYVLINGMTDTDFIISTLRWNLIFFPESTPDTLEQVLGFSTDGTITINEPRGLDFYRILHKTCDELKVDPTALVFMIKTIFVGFNDAGHVEEVLNVKPLMFIMSDIVSITDESGSTYTIEFVGVTNGISKLPQAITAADSISLNARNKNTLAKVIDELQLKINAQYDFFIINLRASALVANVAVDPPGRKVKYVVLLDENYSKEEYKVDQLLEQNKDTGVSKEGGTITLGAGTSIESLIHNIMTLSKRVADDATGKNPEQKRYMPKILTTFRSFPIQDNYAYELVYSIVRTEVPTTTLEAYLAGDQFAYSVKKGNLIEFDYTFTGMNTDILAFDLKQSLGMSFFMALSATDNLNKSQTPNTRSNETIVGATSLQSTGAGGVRENTPLFLSTKVNIPTVRNLQSSESSMEYNALLSQYAAIDSNLNGRVKIVGNPILMNNLIRTPSEVISPTKQIQNELTGASGYSWESLPMMMKVNVKMPTTPEDDNQDFSKPFWYTGLYQLIAVENLFDGGEFTQEIEMISQMVTPSLAKPEHADETAKEQKIRELQEVIANKRKALSALKGANLSALVKRGKVTYTNSPPTEVLTYDNVKKLIDSKTKADSEEITNLQAEIFKLQQAP